MVMAKSRENRLTFATWLMFFRDHGRFPRGPSDLESLDIAALARQIEVTGPADGGLLLAERTAKRLRTEIRVRYGFREATVADADSLTEWLRDHAAAEAGGEIAAMVERLETRCRELAIEPPSVERVERIARAALRAHEERFHADIYGRLSPAIRERLDELLGSAEGENATGSAPATLLTLCGNPGRPSLASMQEELAKLELIRGIDLPADLFNHALPRDLERCRRRVAVEAPHELRRHPDAARITWLAAFVYLRARSLTDDLVDLLIEMTEMQAADRGLRELMLSEAYGRDRVAQMRDLMKPLMERLVERAVAEGGARDDLRAGDIPVLLKMIMSTVEFTRPVSPQAWRRYVTILLDGLCRRRERPTQLTEPELSDDDLHTAMHQLPPDSCVLKPPGTSAARRPEVPAEA